MVEGGRFHPAFRISVHQTLIPGPPTPMLDRCLPQARLPRIVRPDIARAPASALKGGTAIKLFYRDLPRLSVDLDLPCRRPFNTVRP